MLSLINNEVFLKILIDSLQKKSWENRLRYWNIHDSEISDTIKKQQCISCMKYYSYLQKMGFWAKVVMYIFSSLHTTFNCPKIQISVVDGNPQEWDEHAHVILQRHEYRTKHFKAIISLIPFFYFFMFKILIPLIYEAKWTPVCLAIFFSN